MNSPGSISTIEQMGFLNRHFPGVLAAATVAMAASFISDHYGGPVMLITLLLGMAFNFSTDSSELRCVPGIEFASKKILRFGVALLGMRISFVEVQELGLKPVLLVVGSVALTILFGMLLARLLGERREFGILTGGAVAICGASAALAISAALPKNEQSERDTIFTVVGVTALSTVAMVCYPIVAALLGQDNYQAGVFLGATIHDVAQVVGAGYTISEQSGDVATLVKLLRVATLVPIVFLIALLLSGRSRAVGSRAPFPLFLLGFIVTMLANNLLPIPDAIREMVIELSRGCLLIAIAALGMKTALQRLAQVGGNAIILVVAETLFIALLAIAVIHFLF